MRAYDQIRVVVFMLLLCAACSPKSATGDRQIDAKAAETCTSDQSIDGRNINVVTVRPNGEIVWNGEVVSIEEAERRIKLVGASQPKGLVALLPLTGMLEFEPYQKLAATLGALCLTMPLSAIGVIGGT